MDTVNETNYSIFDLIKENPLIFTPDSKDFTLQSRIPLKDYLYKIENTDFEVKILKRKLEELEERVTQIKKYKDE